MLIILVKAKGQSKDGTCSCGTTTIAVVSVHDLAITCTVCSWLEQQAMPGYIDK